MSEYGNHLDVDGNVRAWQARAPGDCVVLGDDLKIPEEYLPEGTVVTTPVQSISISGTLSGLTGGYLTLTATVSPEDATTPAVSWEVTSGTSVAVISSQTGTSCTVYLQSAGEATVTATATDGSGVSQSVTVTAADPVIPVTSIAISGETEGDVGDTVTLAASVLPSNATDRSIAWAITSGSACAIIQSQTDTSCVVSLTAEGTVVITATANDGSEVTGTHTIRVSTPVVLVTDIAIGGETEGEEGTYITLTATVSPSNATNRAVSWAVTSGSAYIAITSQTGTSCTVYCQAEGSGVITATATDGSGVTATHEVSVTVPSTTISPHAALSVSFDATVFATDPGSCLTYTGHLAGRSPVRNTAASLASATDEGSWGFSRNTGIGPLGMFYATFQSGSGGQCLHELLDPYDLSKYIALWDDDSKSWDYGSTGSSHITTENTMLCIPTVYMAGTATSLTVSPNSGDGTAYAHTIGGHTYKYLAIGVYLGYNDSSVLKSLSGVTATGSVTRPNFRTYAAANTVKNGWAGQWNYHQWSLMKYLAWISARHFNLQAVSGQGGLSYNASTTGLCDALGPYAGNVSGTSNAQKHLIENFWGSKTQWIDDAYGSGARLYVGQNASPTDDTSGKVAVTCAQIGGIPGAIETAMPGWGMGSASGGSSTTGLCDYQSSGSDPALRVGGFSGYVSNGNAGPGCLYRGTVSYSNAYIGARLAFAFDL